MSSRLFRTRWEPLPDITAYEIAIDMKCVNASQIVAEDEFAELGTALRHRIATCDREWSGKRMDVVAREIASAIREKAKP